MTELTKLIKEQQKLLVLWVIGVLTIQLTPLSARRGAGGEAIKRVGKKGRPKDSFGGGEAIHTNKDACVL